MRKKEEKMVELWKNLFEFVESSNEYMVGVMNESIDHFVNYN